MSVRSALRAGAVIAALLAAALAGVAPAAADAKVFLPSARENADHTVTLPLLRGTSGGETVWFVVLDASTGDAAARYGANVAQKLANAGAAVQQVSVRNGVIDFPATVDFSPQRVISAPNGFPPAVALPGARGRAGYSPLVRLPDGTVLNAPQLANPSGRADKVVALDTVAGTVRYQETDGFSRNNAVRYVSTDASDELAAALEDVTYAPGLNAAPFPGGDGTDSSRASLAAFVNGRTGAANPQRQGLNSAVADGLDPLNDLAWMPNQGRYSPLWDVHLAAWTAAAKAAGADVRQTAFADVADLARNGLVTAPDGSPFGPSGFIVDCPIISRAG